MPRHMNCIQAFDIEYAANPAEHAIRSVKVKVLSQLQENDWPILHNKTTEYEKRNP
jgi:hypothetical protein